MQHDWPLVMLLLPYQTKLQPSTAAAHLPRMLQHVCNAMNQAGDKTAAAAVLHSGCYCCATTGWQAMSSLQLLALQLIASAAAGHHAVGQQHGQLALHIESRDDTAAPGGDLHLLWCSVTPTLQLCALTGSTYSVQQLLQSAQQLHSIAEPASCAVDLLLLPQPLLAVVVADAAGRWVTCNKALK